MADEVRILVIERDDGTWMHFGELRKYLAWLIENADTAVEASVLRRLDTALVASMIHRSPKLHRDPQKPFDGGAEPG